MYASKIALSLYDAFRVVPKGGGEGGGDGDAGGGVGGGGVKGGGEGGAGGHVEQGVVNWNVPEEPDTNVYCMVRSSKSSKTILH
jgi:hypothetical protein